MDLEDTLRDVLAERAGRADVTAPIAGAAVGAVRRRRTQRRAAVAALAVLAVLVTLAAVLEGRRDRELPSPGTATESPSDVAPVGYRTEVWHDVAVSVPADWGWGAAPTRVHGDPALCAPGAAVGSDGHRYADADPTQPYVGRPIAQTVACRRLPFTPQAPYVWLGADMPVGTVDLGDGWVQQTRSVAGTNVTVASRDASVRDAVLSSAHRWTGGCAPRLDAPPSGASTADVGQPVSMTVCAYAADYNAAHDVTGYDLTFDREVAAPGPAKDLVAAVSKAPGMGTFSCFGGRGGEWVLVRVDGEGGTRRDYVVDMQCPSITGPGGAQSRLTYADVAPWATTGVDAVLLRSPLIRLPVDFFIPSGG